MAGLAKRGVFFTFLAVLIVAVMLVAFLPRPTFNYEAGAPAVAARVNYANDYVKDVDAYVELSLRASGVAALRALSEMINQTAPNVGDSVVYLTEAQLHSYFKDLVLYGRYCDQPSGVCTSSQWKTVPDKTGVSLMQGKTFTERMNAFQDLSSSFLHINVDFEDSFDIGLFQSDYSGPFYVGVNVSMNYTVDAGIVSWNRTNETVTSKVSIEGIYDPLFYRDTAGLKSPQSWHVAVHESGYSEANINTLYYRVGARNYNRAPAAPSFLQRFYDGDLNPSSCCGIESPVNPAVMEGFPSPVAKVHVDWCFYTNRCAGSRLWYVSPINATRDSPPYHNFSLDTAHAASQFYNVVGCLYDSNSADPGCTVCSVACNNVCSSSACYGYDPDCTATGGNTAVCCGDNACDAGESCMNCAADCGCVSGRYCWGGSCPVCSSVCDGSCSSSACYNRDPDCDAAGYATIVCCGNLRCEIGETSLNCAVDCN